MKYLIILIGCSISFTCCKEPFEFKHKYYLVQSESPYPSSAVTLDSEDYFVLIGNGYDSAFPADMSCDSINFCLPCAGCRHLYTYDKDTMFIHSLYGVYKLSPIDSITQKILFASESVRLDIDSGEGKQNNPSNELRIEVKVGYSKEDSTNEFLLQIHDDVITFQELGIYQKEVKVYQEPVDILLYFHKDYPQKERNNLIRELNTDNNLNLFQAYFDTTDIDFISYSELN